MKFKRLGMGIAGILLLVLAGCGGNPLVPLTVDLIDGVGQPLQPLAAAWHAGPPPSTPGSPWMALPTGQSSWSLPLLANTRFQVAFLCPGTGGSQFYVSLDLVRNELGSHLRVHCPRVYASPFAPVSGSVTGASLTAGWVAAEGVSQPLTGTSYGPLNVPQGVREVGVYGTDSNGVPYFGRSGPVNVAPGGSTVNVSVSPVAGSLSVTANMGFHSAASLVLGSFVQLPVVSWFAGNPGSLTQSVPRPTLSGADYLQFWTEHVSSWAIWRYDPSDPAVAPGASLNLYVPPLSLSGNQTHGPNTLPTFSNVASSGFSPGLNLLGYAILLAEPGVRYWRHFISPGALGNVTTYYLDLQTASGFAGVVPSPGSSVQLLATAFAGSQPPAVGAPSTLLGNLLSAKPLPSETIPGHSLFLDRAWPVHLEVAPSVTSFTW